MRRKVLIATVIFAALFFVLPLGAGAQNYTQVFENGKIDWATGIAEAVGIGAPPEKPANMAQARAMAKRAAVTVARRNLLEIIKGVRVDSMTLVKDFVVESDIIRSQVEGYLRDSQVVDIAYMSDGSVEATVAMNTRGGFADLVLPGSIKTIKPVEQPEKPASDKVREVYSGLVVDTRDFQVKPAMSPKILDESGNEVYGSSYVSREYAVSQGMAGYTKDLTAAQTNQRVTDTPFTVKGVRTASTGDCDIVISNSDAAVIKGVAENLEFLQKCRVMIVLE